MQTCVFVDGYVFRCTLCGTFCVLDLPSEKSFNFFLFYYLILLLFIITIIIIIIIYYYYYYLL